MVINLGLQKDFEHGIEVFLSHVVQMVHFSMGGVKNNMAPVDNSGGSLILFVLFCFVLSNLTVLLSLFCFLFNLQFAFFFKFLCFFHLLVRQRVEFNKILHMKKMQFIEKLKHRKEKKRKEGKKKFKIRCKVPTTECTL